MRRIAIIGAGMTGLAAAYFLRGQSVEVFDEHGIGGGASGICGGLIHPYRGLVASEESRAAFGKAKALIGPFLKSPLIRMEKRKDLAPEINFYSTCDASEWTAERICGPAMVFKEGGVVDTPAYLQDLFRRSGAKLISEKVESLTDLSAFDAVVIATGAAMGELVSLPHEVVYGRALIYKCAPMPSGVLGPAYFAPLAEQCTVGATFEHELDPKKLADLKERAEGMAPELKRLPKPDVVIGARLRGPARRPFVERIAPGVWAAGGAGARGLLYHASLGQRVAKEILVDA